MRSLQLYWQKNEVIKVQKQTQTVPTLLANNVVQFAYTSNMLATRENVGQQCLLVLNPL